MIPSIKASIPHDPGCASEELTRCIVDGEAERYACNCPRREKVAFLERLEKPTEKIYDAGYIAGFMSNGFDLPAALRAMMLAAASEES